VRVVYLHVTVNNIKIFGVAQQCFYEEYNVAGNNSIYLGIHLNCPTFLSDFNQIWNLSQK